MDEADDDMRPTIPTMYLGVYDGLGPIPPVESVMEDQPYTNWVFRPDNYDEYVEADDVYISPQLRREILRFVSISSVERMEVQNCGAFIKRLLLLPSFRPEHLQLNPQVFYALRVSTIANMLSFLARLMTFSVLLNTSIVQLMPPQYMQYIDTSDSIGHLTFAALDTGYHTTSIDHYSMGKIHIVRLLIRLLALDITEDQVGQVVTSCFWIAKAKRTLRNRAAVLMRFIGFVRECKITHDVSLFRERCKSIRVAPFGINRSSHEVMLSRVLNFNVDKYEQLLDMDINIHLPYVMQKIGDPDIPTPDYDPGDDLGKQWIRDTVTSLRSSTEQRRLNCTKVLTLLMENPSFSYATDIGYDLSTRDLSNPMLFHEFQRRILQTWATFLKIITQHTIADDILYYQLYTEDEISIEADAKEVVFFESYKLIIFRKMKEVLSMTPSTDARSLISACTKTRLMRVFLHRVLLKLVPFQQILTTYQNTQDVSEFRRQCKDIHVAPFRLKVASNAYVKELLDTSIYGSANDIGNRCFQEYQSFMDDENEYFVEQKILVR